MDSKSAITASGASAATAMRAFCRTAPRNTSSTPNA